ncbi:MAG: DUF1738 domain-containing protein [Planctomycetaceae bacterium]|nr:DUF1738 domain-containing protein [Planctomycetaceae bacterium]
MPVDVYERITARILRNLEAGTIPWRKPWVGGEAGHPRNLASGHFYRGINPFLLACTPYESPYWLTFNQAKKLGGSVRKGEKSTPVIFWKWWEKVNSKTGEKEKFPLLRYYNVFNVAQCDLPSDKLPGSASVPEFAFEPIEVCERVVFEMPDPPEISHEGGTASYRPSDDSIRVPKPERFEKPESYYATLFHELSHSTGHVSRLNRPSVTSLISFGSRSYSKEELIAEMGATFLCGHCGIENTVIENSAAYIAGWLRSLKNDKRLVVHAAAAAQKSADFILGRRDSVDCKSQEKEEVSNV